MKILMIPSWYATEDKPDCGVFFREQAKALRQRGHLVTVAYADLRFKTGSLKKGLYRAAGAPVETYICRNRSLAPFWEAGRIPQKALMLERLYRAVERDYGRPDLIHLQSCLSAPETLWLCRKHRLPLVYTEHYSGVLSGAQGLLRSKLSAALRGSSAAIAVSSALKDAMAPWAAREIEIVPNLVDTEQFIPRRTSGRHGFVFGAMGSLLPVKAYDNLIAAFGMALDDLPGAVLRIAGSGPEAGRLAALIKNLRLENRVFLTGAVEHGRTQEFFNSCSCFVCSSVGETFGAVLIEAASCGVPLLSTKCGGPEDIVRPVNGLLCEPDPASLSKAMAAMFRTAGNYDAKAVREDCIRRFGCSAICGKLEEIYQAAVADMRKEDNLL